jgi:hypothetical protein
VIKKMPCRRLIVRISPPIPPWAFSPLAKGEELDSA